MLQPGEQIRSIAYILRAPGIAMQILLIMVCFWLYFFQVKHYYAALTDRRLILIKTSSGFFRPAIKNAGVEEIPLAGAVNVSTGGFANNKSFTIHRADGNVSLTRNRRALGFIYYSERARIDEAAHAAYQERLAGEMRAAGKI